MQITRDTVDATITHKNHEICPDAGDRSPTATALLLRTRCPPARATGTTGHRKAALHIRIRRLPRHDMPPPRTLLINRPSRDYRRIPVIRFRIVMPSTSSELLTAQQRIGRLHQRRLTTMQTRRHADVIQIVAPPTQESHTRIPRKPTDLTSGMRGRMPRPT